jgi:hypothetical protein
MALITSVRSGLAWAIPTQRTGPVRLTFQARIIGDIESMYSVGFMNTLSFGWGLTNSPLLSGAQGPDDPDKTRELSSELCRSKSQCEACEREDSPIPVESTGYIIAQFLQKSITNCPHLFFQSARKRVLILSIRKKEMPLIMQEIRITGLESGNLAKGKDLIIDREASPIGNSKLFVSFHSFCDRFDRSNIESSC